MLKLMIVDDEFFVRRGIIDSIEWSKYDVEICGEASNGEDALSLFQEVQPHCVLTDIKMGEMNGLEFIEQAQKINKDTVFIILSGYDDFQDAKKAISLGVSEYLLKPIGAEELIETILQVKKKLEKTKEQMLSQSHLFQNSMMLSWNTPGNTILSIENSLFRVFIFRINHASMASGQRANENYNLLSATIIARTEEYLTFGKMNHVVKFSDDNYFIVMLNYKNPIADFQNFLQCFTEYLYAKNNLEIVIGCGKEYAGYHNIKKSYSQAFAAFAIHFCGTNSNTVFVQEVPSFLSHDFMYNLSLQNYKNEIKQFSDVTKFSAEQYATRVSSFLKKLSQDSLSEEAIQTLLVKICILNLSRLPASTHTLVKYLNLWDLLHFTALSSASDIRSFLQNLYDRIHFFLNSRSEDSYKQIVDSVIEYISVNYGKDISLNLLSQKVHITPNYLSKIFRDVVGENFKEWLTQYRISKAKELLLDPSLKIFEIGYRVGFNDYKHFASTFKKYVGCSAKEYRFLKTTLENLSKEEDHC